MKIHTETDFLKAAAEALKNKDVETLYELVDILDSGEINVDFRAYEALLMAMIETVDPWDDEQPLHAALRGGCSLLGVER